jgi:hypothetical protein
MTDLMQVIAELTNECFFAAWAGQEPSIGRQRVEGSGKRFESLRLGNAFSQEQFSTKRRRNA